MEGMEGTDRRRDPSVQGLVYALPGINSREINQTCVPMNSMNFHVHSFGYFADESSFKFPFPLLLFQISVCMLVTRIIYYLLRPLKQPRIVSDILGGILLGPEVLGKIPVFDLMGNKVPFSKLLVGDKDQAVFRTLANVGLMFYLFLVGVKMDPTMIVRSGKKAWAIGVCSFVAPLFATVLLFVSLRGSISARLVGSNFMNSVAVGLSMTSFAVLGDVLAELQLLNSELGRLAMSCSMVHGVFTSFNMVLFVFFNQFQGGVTTVMCVFSSLASGVALSVYAFRPLMLRIVESATAAGGRIEEWQIFAIFAGVTAMGVASDYIGATFVFLPFIMGLCVPDGPPLGSTLVDRAQLLTGEVMMPLLFLVGGKEVTFRDFTNKFWMMFLVCFVGFVTKLVGTVVPAVLSGVPRDKAYLLGLIMNFRGLVEYITFLNYLLGSVLGRQSYTVTVTYIVLSTAVSAPLVSTLYKPMGKRSNVGRRSIQHLKPGAELRLLVCLHNESPVPSLVNLLDLSCPSAEAPMCVFVLHLVELAGRANSSLVAHKNKKGFINPSEMARLHNVFINYEQDNRGCVSVQPYTSVAPFKTIHQDICSLAAEKSVLLVVVPFRRVTSTMGAEDLALRTNISQILAQAPCSVGIIVYPDDMAPVVPLSAGGNYCYQIGVFFWGGPDDREALAYASRMAHHGRISLTIVHFVRPADQRNIKQRQLDDSLLSKVRFENNNNECVAIDEVLVRDMEQTIAVIRSLGNSYNLIIVGRKQGPNSLLHEGLADWSECPELGVVGDMLASKDFESSNSILVVQQRPTKGKWAEKTP